MNIFRGLFLWLYSFNQLFIVDFGQLLATVATHSSSLRRPSLFPLDCRYLKSSKLHWKSYNFSLFYSGCFAQMKG